MNFWKKSFTNFNNNTSWIARRKAFQFLNFLIFNVINSSSYYLIPLFLLLSLFPTKLSSDCTPGIYGFRGYSFINPDIIDTSVPSAPLFIDIQAIYEAFGGQKVVQEVNNVMEWRERYCRRATEADIQFAIYETDTNDLKQLREDVRYKEGPLSYPFTDNSFAQYLKRYECVETVDYLIYAKRCEPHVSNGDDPWQTPERDDSTMQVLINEGINAFKITQSHYIRLRYAYQIIRLAHYRKDYAHVLSLYDVLMPQIDNDPSIIEDWIEGHRAGALMGLGRNVEASYIFSKIFENCTSKAESAYRSFKINTDEEWEACLRLCGSDRERATLYVIRAQSSDSKALEEMKRIYELDPENRHLEILLINEIHKLEKDLLGLGFNDERAHNRRLGYPRIEAGRYAIGLHSFMMQVLEAGKVDRLPLWQTALGYLETLMGNYYDAEHSFAQAEKIVKLPLLKEQLQVFRLVLKISAFQEASEAVEVEVNKIRTDKWYRKYRDFSDFLSDKMTVLYREGNAPGKAFLSNHRFLDLKVNPKLPIIEDLLAICRKPNRTSLETALITKSGGGTIEKDLIEMKATLLLSEYRLEEALNVYKEIDRTLWDNYGVFNPFIERFKDCVRCPLPDTSNMYNKGELLERLMSLESLARTDTENSAEYYFDLGLAFYNMSYFSYDWKILDYFRSGSSLMIHKLRDGDNIVSNPTYSVGNQEHFDCSRALFYFEKARELARNAEMAAKATYWAAKCERNTWYVNRAQGARHTYEYFGILKTEYNNTDFYKRVVRECKTFKAYLAR